MRYSPAGTVRYRSPRSPEQTAFFTSFSIIGEISQEFNRNFILFVCLAKPAKSPVVFDEDKIAVIPDGGHARQAARRPVCFALNSFPFLIRAAAARTMCSRTERSHDRSLCCSRKD